MERFIAYLDSRIEEGKEEIKALEADGRRDDANFAKIRTNIYDVCKKIAGALTFSLKIAGKPEEAAGAVKAQFERLSSTWGAALEKARENDDVVSIAVEETKLAALEDITDRFKEVTGE